MKLWEEAAIAVPLSLFRHVEWGTSARQRPTMQKPDIISRARDSNSKVKPLPTPPLLDAPQARRRGLPRRASAGAKTEEPDDV